MTVMDILNYFQVTEKIATSGQPTENDFEEIASLGYAAVINLAMPNHETSIAQEGEVISSLGMTYIHIPVPFNAPTVAQLAEFSGYMDTLKNQKVWVHCVVNARVSAFLFCYLQNNRGLSALASTTPLLEQWLPQMDDVWQEFLSNAPSH